MTNASTSPNAKPKVMKKKSSPSKKGSPGRNGASGPQRILDFIVAMEGKMNSKEIPRKMVMAASGVKKNTFPVTISGMKKKGLIQYDTKSIWLTQDGRAKANPDAVLETFDNESAQNDNIVRFKIGGKALSLFNEMRDGKEYDRVSLAAKVGITNKGTLAVLLSNMKKKGVFSVTKTTLQLSDINFPLGRPADTTSEE